MEELRALSVCLVCVSASSAAKAPCETVGSDPDHLAKRRPRAEPLTSTVCYKQHKALQTEAASTQSRQITGLHITAARTYRKGNNTFKLDQKTNTADACKQRTLEFPPEEQLLFGIEESL